MYAFIFESYGQNNYGVCFFEGAPSCEHAYVLTVNPITSYVSGNLIHVEATLTMADGSNMFYPEDFTFTSEIAVSGDGNDFYFRSFQEQYYNDHMNLYREFTIPAPYDAPYFTADSIWVKANISFTGFEQDSLGNTHLIGFSITQTPWKFPTQNVITGINSTTSGKILNIFPNPATDKITVSSKESSVTLYDMIGKQIKTIPTNIAVEITLPHGQYYVREENGKTKKFTVQ